MIRAFATLVLLFGSLSYLEAPAVLAQGQASRGTEAAARAQERANDAIERATSAQERSAAATERAVSAQSRAADASQRAAEATLRGSERSALALEQAPRGQDGATTQDYRRARTRSRGKPIDPYQTYRALVGANRQALEMVGGQAAVKGEIIAIDAGEAVIARLVERGYQTTSREAVAGLGFDVTTLALPAGQSVETALDELRTLERGTEFAPNDIFLQSGAAVPEARSRQLAPDTPIQDPAIGLIDGGVAVTSFAMKLVQKGFALGAPLADPHATALASLAAGRGKVASAAPGAPLYVADIYGADPRGGNALAVAQALGWMAQLGVPVVIIGLVGPDNPVLRRAVMNARAGGMIIVAPVGNAGAAAPPLYPAAYDAVIGVTGVDKRNRALVEAGRGPHVHFAAPGAGLAAATGGDQISQVRGTSFAAPLVAGLLWRLRNHNNPVASLEAEALDLGAPGRDRVFGVGLVCSTCR